jgi:hypothetical protein
MCCSETLLSIDRKPELVYRFNASQWFCTYPIAPPGGLLGSTSGFCASSHVLKCSKTGTDRSWRTRSRIAARAGSSASGGSFAISALIAVSMA